MQLPLLPVALATAAAAAAHVHVLERRTHRNAEEKKGNAISAKYARRPGGSTTFEVPLGHFEALLGRLWGQLGPSWGYLGAFGPSWGQLGATLGHLEASWGHLGPSWVRLRAILGPSRGHPGASLGHLGASWLIWFFSGRSCTAPRREHHLRGCRGPFRSLLEAIARPSWPSWSYRGALKPSWGHFGVSWGRLGDFSVAS